MSDNTVTVIGNLTADPTITYSAGGTAVATIKVAVNRRYQSGGEWKEQVSYFKVTAFGQHAENITGSFLKGDRVVVVGRLQSETYETKDGRTVTEVGIVADDVAASTRWATVDMARTARTNTIDKPTQRPTRPSKPADDEEAF